MKQSIEWAAGVRQGEKFLAETEYLTQSRFRQMLSTLYCKKII
jgi:hypothetical protein